MCQADGGTHRTCASCSVSLTPCRLAELDAMMGAARELLTKQASVLQMNARRKILRQASRRIAASPLLALVAPLPTTPPPPPSPAPPHITTGCYHRYLTGPPVAPLHTQNRHPHPPPRPYPRPRPHPHPRTNPLTHPPTPNCRPPPASRRRPGRLRWKPGLGRPTVRPSIGSWAAPLRARV